MWKNYLVTALRNLRKHKGHTLINILGLAIGMAASLLIFLYVQREISYDQFHSKADRIQRVLLLDKSLGVIRIWLCRNPIPWCFRKNCPELYLAIEIQ